MVAQEGFSVEVVITGARPGALPADFAGAPVSALADACDHAFDVAIATWWTTASALFEVRAARRVIFLQSFENRFYREDDHVERFAAEVALCLPVDFIVVAPWMRELLAELRPGAGCLVVRNGIDKAVYRPRKTGSGEGPLRVLVEGQRELWFKAVPEAARAVEMMQSRAEVTLVEHTSSPAPEPGFDTVVGGLSPGEMAELYGANDVLLKLSRVESLALPPVEAMHVGLPSVVTPYTGHEEYLAHGENGFVVGYDDLEGTAAVLDLLAGDRALLARLSDGALRTARDWPGDDHSTTAFADALEQLAQEAPPTPEPALRDWGRAERRRIELSREYVRQASVRLEHSEAAKLAEGERRIAVERTLAENERTLAENVRTLELVRQERAYRLALAARAAAYRAGRSVRRVASRGGTR